LRESLSKAIWHFPHWGGRIRRYSAVEPSSTGMISDRLLVVHHPQPQVTMYVGRYEGKQNLLLDLTKASPGSVDELTALSGPQYVSSIRLFLILTTSLALNKLMHEFVVL
jgi:hypothetical protein